MKRYIYILQCKISNKRTVITCSEKELPNGWNVLVKVPECVCQHESIFKLPELQAGKDYKALSAQAVIINKNREILLTYRLKKPYNNLWGLPGGKVEFNETCEEACIREIYEETGLNILVKSIVGILDNTKWVVPIYLCKVYDGILQNKEPNINREIKFFDVKKMPDDITPGLKRIKNTILNLV